MRLTLVFLLVGCSYETTCLPSDIPDAKVSQGGEVGERGSDAGAGARDGSASDGSVGPEAGVAGSLPWPQTCGSVRGQYVACCPAGEACEVGTCDCMRTPPAEGLTVCRRLLPDWVTVCYKE